MPKKIKIKSVSILSIDKNATSMWEDLWFTITVKPGRKKLNFFPCIISRKSFEDDYKLYKEHKKEFPEYYVDDFISEEFYTKCLEKINNNEIFIFNNDNYIDIVVPDEYLTRENCEKALSELLKTHGINSAIFKWKRSNIIIESV